MLRGLRHQGAMDFLLGTPVRQPLNAAFLVAIEDLVTCFAGNAELPAEFRHWLAG